MDRRTFLAGGAVAAMPAHPDESKERYYSEIRLWECGGFAFHGTAAEANNIIGQYLAQGGSALPPFEAFALASGLVFEAGLR